MNCGSPHYRRYKARPLATTMWASAFLLSSAFGCIEDNRKRRVPERKPHFVGEEATHFLFRGKTNIFPELYPALPLAVFGRCVLYIFDNVCWLTIQQFADAGQVIH